MLFELFETVPNTLMISTADLGGVVIGVVLAACFAVGWVRANRRKDQLLREERDRLQRETERFERELAEQRAASDRALEQQRQELEAKAAQELEQVSRTFEEKVEAARAETRLAAQQEIEQHQQAAEREREEARQAAEREREEARQAAERELDQARQTAEQALEQVRHAAEQQHQQLLQQSVEKQEQIRLEMFEQLEQAKRESAQELQQMREDAERRAQQAITDANQAIEQAQATFATRLAEATQQRAAEIEQLRTQHAAELAQSIQHHGADLQSLQASTEELTRRAQEAAKQRAVIERELHEIKVGQTQRLNRIHRVWDEQPLSEPPRFFPATERKTRFISVANLKGGVGKTTIAGNAGLSLAHRGHRVLLVDLDFQGSLSQVSLDRATLTAKIKRRETARAFFDQPMGDMDVLLDRIIHPVHCTPADASGKCDVIAAWNDLADVELREEARWILQPECDARYKIRQILHRPEFCERYDYVIFDCPPRLTTAAVNALAASDGVIVPIMLDWQSAAPILYMLRRLRDLKNVLAGGRVIGMVANQVRYKKDKPVQQMQAIFKLVCQRLDAEQLTAEDAFRVMVKAESGIGSEVNAGRLAASQPSLRPLFDDLVTEIERVTRYESLALV